jgi:cytochrome P450
VHTSTIDLLSPEVRRDPFPVYRELRRRGPACQVDPGGMWVLSRYGDVAHALHDPATFSSQGFRAAFTPDWLGDDRLASMLLLLDPPEHTKLRRLISRQFGQELVTSLERPLRAFLKRTLAELDTSREIEVVGEIATPIAAAVMAMILDVPPEHHVRFKRWVDLIGSITPFDPGAATASAIRGAIEDQHAYFREVLERRRRDPGSDVVSLLLRSEVDGRVLTTEDLIGLLILLLGAGIDTTIHLLSKSLLLLAERPDLLARLHAESRLIPAFLEEMLRFDPPTHALPRLTTRDVQFESATIPAQSLVLLLLASANRDPAQYPDPDQFSIERAPRGALSFGHGPHLCVGAALARFEAKLVLETLLERFAGFERDASVPIAWDATLHTRGPLRLPMRLAGPSKS